MIRRPHTGIPRPVMRRIVRTTVRPILGPDIPVTAQRRRLDALARISRLPRGAAVTAVRLGGRPAERITAGPTDDTRATLYLHGGGYTVGSPTTHRALAAHLAQATGAPVYLLDYRLAPEHPFPGGLEDAVGAYRALLESGLAPGRIAVAGDSAGGGLAVALALRLREDETPRQAILGLISPWVDLTLTHVSDDPRDPMLRRAWLRSCAEHYAGDERAHPHVSPALADLSGLPPMVVHGASDEILRPDIDRFAEAARHAGVAVHHRRLAGLWHVSHLHAGLMKESTQDVHQLGTDLRNATTIRESTHA